MMRFIAILLSAILAAGDPAFAIGVDAVGGTTQTVSTLNCSGSSINIDGGTLYVDCANNLVGEGTTTPAYKNHTAGGAYVSGQQIVGGTVTVQGNAFSIGVSTIVVTSGKVAIGTENPGSKLHLSTGTLIIDGDAATSFQIGTSSVIVLGSGNLGIGVSPVYLLHVAGAGYLSGQAIIGSSLTVNGNAFSVGGSTFVVSGSSVGIGVSPGNKAALEIKGGAGRSLIALDNGTDDWDLQVTSNGDVVISESGVSNHIWFKQTTGGLGLGAQPVASVKQEIVTSSLDFLQFSTGTAESQRHGKFTFGVDTNNSLDFYSSASHALSLGANGASGKIAVGVDGTIKLNAATTVTQSSLTVTGNAVSTGVLLLPRGSGDRPTLQFAGANEGVSSDVSGGVSFWTNGVSRASITSTGFHTINKYNINGLVAFSSVPVMHAGATQAVATLASGTTFFAFTPDSAVTLKRLTSTIQGAGVGGSGDTIRCNDASDNGLQVTPAAAAAAGTITTVTSGGVNIAASTTINCHIETAATTRPVFAIAIEYTMQ